MKNPLAPVSGQDVTDWQFKYDETNKKLQEIKKLYEDGVYDRTQLLSEIEELKNLLKLILKTAKPFINAESKKAWCISNNLFKKIKEKMEEVK